MYIKKNLGKLVELKFIGIGKIALIVTLFQKILILKVLKI